MCGQVVEGRLDAMHLVENLFLLTLDFQTLGLANGGEAVTEFAEGDVAVVNVDNHHHGEVITKGGLGDVEDVYVVFGEIGADGSDDTDGILAYYGYDCAIHMGGY